MGLSNLWDNILEKIYDVQNVGCELLDKAQETAWSAEEAVHNVDWDKIKKNAGIVINIAGKVAVEKAVDIAQSNADYDAMYNSLDKHNSISLGKMAVYHPDDFKRSLAADILRERGAIEVLEMYEKKEQEERAELSKMSDEQLNELLRNTNNDSYVARWIMEEFEQREYDNNNYRED